MINPWAPCDVMDRRGAGVNVSDNATQLQKGQGKAQAWAAGRVWISVVQMTLNILV